jgi:hypothetical protein
MTRELTAMRKSDRETMAKLVIKLATDHAAEFEQDELPREIALKIRTLNGLCLRVEFDGGCSAPDTFIASWFMTTDSEAQLSDEFARACKGIVNPWHKQKATSVCYGWTELYTMLQHAFYCIYHAGEAFLPE